MIIQTKYDTSYIYIYSFFVRFSFRENDLQLPFRLHTMTPSYIFLWNGFLAWKVQKACHYFFNSSDGEHHLDSSHKDDFK